MVSCVSTQRVRSKRPTGRLFCRLLVFVLILSLLAPMPAMTGAATGRTTHEPNSASAKNYVTDGQGRFWIQLDPSAPNPTIVTVQAGHNSQDFRLAGSGIIPDQGLSLVQDVAQTFPVGTAVNSVVFTLTDAANPASVQNQTITLSWSGTGAFTTPPTSVTTDSSGKFTLPSLTGGAGGTVTLTVTLPDNRTASCDLAIIQPLYIVVVAYADGPDFQTTGHSTGSVTVKVTNADGSTIADGTTVTWTVTKAQNNSPAMYQGWGARTTGLTWGASATPVLCDNNPDLTASTTSTTTGGQTTIQLTDIVGERNITIKAAAQVDGAERSVEQVVAFGNGPLVTFKAPPDATFRTWQQVYQVCNGVAPSGADDPAHWTAADDGVYRGGGKMANIQELQTVSALDTSWGSTNPVAWAKGAGYAAGWPDTWYWAGVAVVAGFAFSVGLYSGGAGRSYVSTDFKRAVCRRESEGVFVYWWLLP